MTQKSLTKRQFDVLSFVGNFIATKGYSPTFGEIGQGLSLTSLATVHKHISNLSKKGAVTYEYNKTRSLALTPQGQRRLTITAKLPQKVSCPQCQHEFEVRG